MAIKVKTFLCIGGPFDGHRVTHQAAGYREYVQFNNAGGRDGGRGIRIGNPPTLPDGRPNWQTVKVPYDNCVLVHNSLIENVSFVKRRKKTC